MHRTVCCAPLACLVRMVVMQIMLVGEHSLLAYLAGVKNSLMIDVTMINGLNVQAQLSSIHLPLLPDLLFYSLA